MPKKSTVLLSNAIKHLLSKSRNSSSSSSAKSKSKQKRKFSIGGGGSRSRMSFFLTEFPTFFFYLFVSYAGILWVSFEILSADANDFAHTFIIAKCLLQKLCALSTMFAFISFWMQAHGCIGEGGIKPIHETLAMTTALANAGSLTLNKYLYQPTIFWLYPKSNAFLHCVLFCGTFSSALIVCNFFYPFANCVLFLICALLYSSLKIVGAEFLQLQWDSMLIEVNLICVFCELDALWSLNNGGALSTATAYNYIDRNDSFASRISVVLVVWLHYRLMLSAGIVKLSSGCPKWRNGSAMRYHFWTQPIPNPISYVAFLSVKNSPCMAKFATYSSMVSELFLPFLLLFPFRIARTIAALNTIGLMFIIFMSGNFGFFNILTASLAITCFDDDMFIQLTQALFGTDVIDLRANLMHNSVYYGITPRNHNGSRALSVIHMLTAIFSLLWFVLILVASLRALWHVTYTRVKYPCQILQTLSIRFAIWSIVNSYGLFARMTTFRHELIIEGTMDNHVWHTYEFKYKPGDIDRHPPFCVFHLPRLDWRLWFLPLRAYNARKHKWFLKFVKKLLLNGCQRQLEGKGMNVNAVINVNDDTLRLLKLNPFQANVGRLPLKSIRVWLYEYRFKRDFCEDESGAEAIGLTGDDLEWDVGRWWMRRDLKKMYLPIITRENSHLFGKTALERFENMIEKDNILMESKSNTDISDNNNSNSNSGQTQNLIS